VAPDWYCTPLSVFDIIPETVLRDFFLGFVRVHVLHHAAQAPIYGLAMLEELRRHGYALGPGTLYPLLHGLEADGYLVRADRVVGGKVRKYYAATPAGRAALAELRGKIRELVDEVLEGQGPDPLLEPAAETSDGDGTGTPAAATPHRRQEADR
jgi:DNA-binding PadR family transcriptional regulator